jgi:hypothetical protein
MSMSEQDKAKAAGRVLEINIASELGRMRLLPGEDEGLFRRFRERTLEEIEPRDLMEEILVRDWIYYAWDVLRFQRYKSNLLALGSERSAAVIARSAHSGAKDAPALQDCLILGEAETVMCGAFDETLSGKLKLMAGLDCLLESAQAGRTRALQELHRYRSDLASRAQTADKIVDAEFRTLGPPEEDEPRLKTYVS